MHIKSSVDWLRVTVPAEHANAKSVLSNLDCTLTDSYVKAFGWYDTAVLLHGGGRVDWHSKDPEQGTLYTFTGKDLTAQALRGIYPLALINQFRTLGRVHFTRIDLAIDLLLDGRDPTDLMDAYRAGKVKTHVQTAKITEKYRKLQPRNGVTTYFGSRKGERMLRCYDKAAEQGVEGPWTRLELECKGQQSDRAAQALQKQAVGRVASGMMGELIMFEVAWYKDTLEQCQAGNFDAEHMTRHEGTGNAWLYNVALPSVIRALENGDAETWARLQTSFAQMGKRLTNAESKSIL